MLVRLKGILGALTDRGGLGVGWPRCLPGPGLLVERSAPVNGRRRNAPNLDDAEIAHEPGRCGEAGDLARMSAVVSP
jgi:hypothetical protein